MLASDDDRFYRVAHFAFGTLFRNFKLIGSSSDSWEFAAQNAVRETSKSYKDIHVAEVVEMDVLIEAGLIIAYRTKLRLSFKSGTVG